MIADTNAHGAVVSTDDITVSNSVRTVAHNVASNPASTVDDGEGSVFSEKNPLPSDFDQNALPVHHEHSKVPKAVVLTGWSRTVGADQTIAPPPTVTLGAPGTGLSSAALATEKALGPTLGRKARVERASSSRTLHPSISSKSWTTACVTADDLAAAAALRKVRPPDDAVLLPSPRPWSETDASSIAESPASIARRRRERGFQSQSSSASSDLNFLVAPGTGSFFGTRPTVGRAVEKRIPATVGEATLHDSLAKYFGHKVEDPRTEGAISSGGAFAAGSATAAPSSFSQKSDEQSSSVFVGAGSSIANFTPATKSATRESSFEDGVVVPIGADGSGGRRKNVADRTKFADIERLELKFYSSMTEAEKAAAAAASGALGDGSSSENTGSGKDSGMGALLDEETTGRARKSKQRTSVGGTSNSNDYVDARQGGRLCGCARTWPWKVFLGVTMFVALVAVVTVVSSGGESAGNRRRILRVGHRRIPEGAAAQTRSGRVGGAAGLNSMLSEGWRDVMGAAGRQGHAAWPLHLRHTRRLSEAVVDRGKLREQTMWRSTGIGDSFGVGGIPRQDGVARIERRDVR